MVKGWQRLVNTAAIAVLSIFNSQVLDFANKHIKAHFWREQVLLLPLLEVGHDGPEQRREPVREQRWERERERAQLEQERQRQLVWRELQRVVVLGPCSLVIKKGSVGGSG